VRTSLVVAPDCKRAVVGIGRPLTPTASRDIRRVFGLAARAFGVAHVRDPSEVGSGSDQYARTPSAVTNSVTSGPIAPQWRQSKDACTASDLLILMLCWLATRHFLHAHAIV
jgi:hypothetical protein